MSRVIHALLERGDASLRPEDVGKLVAGFDTALANLGLNPNDPDTAAVAKLIIQLAKNGERDPRRLAERATEIVRRSS
jgi:hypothetical protein